ncbi:MAG: hypothetical protein WBM13_01730 [Bacteroidia bacterium]
MEKWTTERKKELSKIIMSELANGSTLNSLLEENNRGELPNIAEFLGWMDTDVALKTQYLQLTRYSINC